MSKVFGCLIFVFLCFQNFAKANCTLALDINSVIGPATMDYLERGVKTAQQKQCSSYLLRINTPGGNLQTTRLIVEKILGSERPFLCLVTPAGGHAGSAGAIILQACHVSGALEATNIGAATPVASTGQEIGKDMRKKLINDTLSWVEGLADLRKRNKKFAREIVSEAKAVSAKEALKLGSIDILAQNESDFLDKAKGKKIQLTEQKEAVVEIGEVVPYQQDLRYKTLNLITDPQFAYTIFMGSLGLLYFELTHPGMIVPGIVGGVGLIVSLVSFHKLNADWAGVLLILLGLILMMAEAFVPSFGALGLGGMASFVFGGLLLFDSSATGVSLPLYVLLVPALLLGAISFFLARLAYKSFEKKKTRKKFDYKDLRGKVVSLGEQGEGQIEIQGETWKFHSSSSVALGEEVQVIDKKGLTFEVQKIKKQDS